MNVERAIEQLRELPDLYDLEMDCPESPDKCVPVDLVNISLAGNLRVLLTFEPFEHDRDCPLG